MTATIYKGKNNDVTIELLQDGQPPVKNVITDAILWIPGNAFSDGVAQTFDTSSSVLTLTKEATRINLELGSSGIQVGTYQCYLSVYDPDHPDGIAWDTITVIVKDWPSA